MDRGDETADSACMTAVAMLCRQFLGSQPKEPVLIGGANHILKNMPALSKAHTNYYYIYYGTLCMFQMGGDYWSQWNEYFRDPIVEHQVKEGTVQQLKGSWDPGRQWTAKAGGRVYSTAMAVLSLEVYYRYLPMYK